MKEDLAKESDVFLVDHAWLTQFNEARKQLKALPNLVQRLYSMMDLDAEDQEEEEDQEEGTEEGTEQEEPKESEPESTQEESAEEVSNEVVDKIWNKMWKYLQTFNMAGDQWWYMMDEVGSAMQHSDTPNFKCKSSIL
jgi:tubulin--tyrosine ligase-like protein 12